MSRNKLKLNPDITEFLLIGNERQRSKYLSMFPIELLGVKTYPAKSARNLGVIFNKNFNFHSHISAICSSCIYHTRDLRRIRRHLDLDSAKLLVNALVSSHLDYCNSLLSWIAETDLIISLLMIACCMFLFPSGDCCSTEWSTFMLGLCPILDVNEKTETEPR